jgi:hypothetical protein
MAQSLSFSQGQWTFFVDGKQAREQCTNTLTNTRGKKTRPAETIPNIHLPKI